MATRAGVFGLAAVLLAVLAAPGQGAPQAHKLTASGTRVFHLNCGTFTPPSAWLVNGEGGLFAAGRLVSHCLLVETDRGLVLVDTGLGVEDVERPEARFNWAWFTLVRPTFDRVETARHQIERLGFQASDVTDIVLTHLDVDHVGGLPDFPHARVHLSRAEYDRVEGGADRFASIRWSHGPRWVPHELVPDTWRGLASSELVPGLKPEIRLVGLPGHTPGHAGVAVRQGARWLLHVGDAYYHRAEVAGAERRCPPALEAMHRIHSGTDATAFAATQEALRRLKNDPAVRMVSAHDPVESRAFGPGPLLPLLAEAGR